MIPELIIDGGNLLTKRWLAIAQLRFFLVLFPARAGKFWQQSYKNAAIKLPDG
ncbi:MAG: hypothetical protein SAJ37_05005 [Oscillatoria sp. PMC 1068.18]|nr:hypothetical protein [Oscillatoria sp. PMC 1076.18]MEC4988088.1 hypothetical protein [Oscillatoria sp. PMC 1068.18]